MRRDADYLQDMAIAASKALRFVRGLDYPMFVENDEKQAAVFGQLIVLGEAANHVSAAEKSRHPTIPWRQIIATRNRIVHGYDDVDCLIIWDIATRELPQLLHYFRDHLPIADCPG